MGFITGSAIGSFVPELWGAGVFSFSSILMSAAGGILGIWLAFRLAD